MDTREDEIDRLTEENKWLSEELEQLNDLVHEVLAEQMEHTPSGRLSPKLSELHELIREWASDWYSDLTEHEQKCVGRYEGHYHPDWEDEWKKPLPGSEMEDGQ